MTVDVAALQEMPASGTGDQALSCLWTTCCCTSAGSIILTIVSCFAGTWK